MEGNQDSTDQNTPTEAPPSPVRPGSKMQAPSSVEEAAGKCLPSISMTSASIFHLRDSLISCKL